MTKPDWFIELERDLNASVMVPDGAIDWDRCRDRFLIALLQRLEKRSSSPHPAIVRGLLERSFAGEDVTAELSAAAWAATADADAAWAAYADATWAAYAAAWAAWAAYAAAWAAYAYAADAAARAAAERADRHPLAAAAERADQLADLRTAIAAATQQPALPDGYLDGDITGPDRELLEAFYTACNSEGGSADEINLRGIHAAIAQAATGVTVPSPVADALRRLLRWGGMPGSNGYDAQVVLGVVDWATSGMIGPLPPLPPLRPLLARPVDLAALHDPTFSDGLTPSQHRDVLAGGADPRVPEPVTPKPVVDYSRVPEIASNAQIRAAAQYLIKKRNCDGDLIPAIEYAIARWGTAAIQPVPVSERPWEREGWCDAKGSFWAEHISRGGTASWRYASCNSLGGWAQRCLPHWALPVPANTTKEDI